MEIDSDEQYQQLGENNQQSEENNSDCNLEEIQQSVYRQPPPKVNKGKYSIEINESEKKVAADMSIVQSQYYLVKVMKDKQVIKENILRRFSDFDFLFELLFKKYPGVIFPAFPDKGILSYVKTKVSIAKDAEYLKDRIRVVERFMNKILNEQRFQMTQCEEMRKFLSDNLEFELYKKGEKGKQSWTMATPWNKLKGYFKFTNSADNKYQNFQEQLAQSKLYFEELHSKVKQVSNLLEAQNVLNQELRTKDYISFSGFKQYTQKVISNAERQSPLIKELKLLEFQLQCENEDFVMVFSAIQNRQDLKQNEETYKLVYQFQSVFSNQHILFKKQKQQKKDQLTKKFMTLLEEVKNVGSI